MQRGICNCVCTLVEKIEVWSCGAFLAFLLALSRVYVGVHYPFDVVSGVLVALIAFLLVR
ncbi:phosphatase PAP2 family protein [Pueribacillus sp. YX66]|uniref:phosphatase PAP2 family protein n=1 Tax=Pueribacillus sp. YX66 TaxID=3229242 RepID=UPI00358D6DF4